MKQFFRNLTAEVNGYYLKAMHDFMNTLTEQIKEVLTYTSSVQFKTEAEDLSAFESAMRDEDIRGIGKIAGVFTPYISAESNLGSLVFTNSKVVNGKEYSTRGLFDMQTESFKFFRTDEGVYATDLDTLATTLLRSSLVPLDAPIVGYVAEGDIVLTTDGHIIPGALLATPPVGKAYYPYFGEKYLFLAETFMIEAFLDIETYKAMLESFQRMRYNGASITELYKLTALIMEDYVEDIYFEPDSFRQVMYYKFNQESELAAKTKRTFVWTQMLSTKFKQLVPVEVIV
jgi:hypothetical protein